jgi:hypothetical protein
MIVATSCVLLVLVGQLLTMVLQANLAKSSRPTRESVGIVHPTADQLISTLSAFLKAESIDEKGGYVRNREDALAKMQSYYTSNELVPPWISTLPRSPGALQASLQTINGREAYQLALTPVSGVVLKALFFVEEGQLKLDWDAFAEANGGSNGETVVQTDRLATSGDDF